MSTPLAVNVVANLAQFRAAFNQATDVLTVTKGQLASLTASFDGSKIISQANAAVAALNKMGGELGVDAGLAQLTTSEQAKLNAMLGAAIEKYTALGKAAPEAMLQVQQATQQTHSVTEQLSSKLKNLGSSILEDAAGFATGLVSVQALEGGFDRLAGFAEECVRAFLDGESAAKKIDAALRSAGTYTPALAQQYRGLGEELQTLTVNSHAEQDAAIALFTSLGHVGPENMEAALKAANDLSAGLGMDLNAAVELVSKALTGHLTALQRYGIQVEKSADSGKNFENVLAAVESRFGGQAQAEIQTTAGHLKQLANAWDDVKEIIGGIVVQSGPFQDFMKAADLLLKEQAADAKKAAEAYGQYMADYMNRYVAGHSGATFGDAIRQFGGADYGKDINLAGPSTGTGIADLTRQLDDLQKSVAAVSPATRDLILRATELGVSASDVSAKLGIEEDIVQRIVSAHRDAASAVKQHQEEQLRLAQAEEKAIVAANDATLAAVRKFNADSLSGAALRDVASQAKAASSQIHLALPDYDATADALNAKMIPAVKSLSAGMTGLAQIKPVDLKATEPLTELQKLHGALTEVSKDFQELSQIADGSMSDVARDIGTVTAATLQLMNAWDVMTKEGASKVEKLAGAVSAVAAGAQIASALGGGKTGGAIGYGIAGAEIGAEFGGPMGALIGGGIGAVGGLLEGAFHNTGGRDAVSAFADKMGGYDELHQKLDALGAAGEQMWIKLTQGVPTGNKDAANAAVLQVKAALANYDQQQVLVQQHAKDLQTQFDRLPAAVTAFGGVAPAQLKPIIAELQQMNGLTADQKTLLEQLASDPSMNAIKQAADDLGVSFDHMGQNFKATQIDQQAFQFQHDLEMLAQSGADMGGVLADAKDKLNKLAQDAVANGVSLPATLKPYLEKLSDMGDLLGPDGLPMDISKLSFADIPDTALDTIKQILGDIRDLLAKGIPDAAKNAGKALADLPKGGAASGDSGSADAGQTPDMSHPGFYTDGSPDYGWPYADMPVSLVKTPGAVFVNPGDIIGMPKYGSNLPASGSSAVINIDLRGAVMPDANTAAKKIAALVVPHLPAELKVRGVIR